MNDACLCKCQDAESGNEPTWAPGKMTVEQCLLFAHLLHLNLMARTADHLLAQTLAGAYYLGGLHRGSDHESLGKVRETIKPIY